MYEAFINGQRVGDAYLTPDWTSYNKQLQYQVYDVTPMLQAGNNVIGVALGSGWYRGNIGWKTNKNFYGKQLALLFQMHITYSDGSTETVVSDGSWKTATGAIRDSEIYHGEYTGVLNEWAGNCNTNHQSVIAFKGKSYFIYHDGALSADAGSFRRSVCVDDLYYNPDGTIQPIRMTSKGVKLVK